VSRYAAEDSARIATNAGATGIGHRETIGKHKLFFFFWGGGGGGGGVKTVARLFEIWLVVITLLRISIRNLRNYGDTDGLRSVFQFLGFPLLEAACGWLTITRDVFVE
jgi:hypothetical protein